MGCITVRNPQGINPDCIKYINAADNIIIMDAGVKFNDIGKFRSLEEHRKNIQENLTEYLPVGLKGYEPTPGEVNLETSDFDGSSTVTYESPPSMIMQVASNPCDWNEMMAQVNGEGFRIAFVMKKTGDILAAQQPDGSIQGFYANAFAQALQVPPQGESFSTYNLQLNFQRVQEWRYVALADVPFNPMTDLVSRMPLGLSMTLATAYTTGSGSVDVVVYDRCGDATTGALDVEAVESYDATTGAPIANFAGSATDNGNGSYTITITKDAVPVNLAVGDWAIIRVGAKTASVYNSVSNELLVEVAS